MHVDCGPGRGLDAAGHLSEALCWRAEALWTFRLTERTDQERNEASRQEIEKQGLWPRRGPGRESAALQKAVGTPVWLGLLRGWWRRPWGPRDTLSRLQQAGGLIKPNWCFWTVVLEKILKSPSDCKEIKPVHPKGNQSWMFIGRTDAEAETPLLWPPDVKNWLTGKDPDAGKDWRWEKKGTTEVQMVGWHHWLSGHELE